MLNPRVEWWILCVGVYASIGCAAEGECTDADIDPEIAPGVVEWTYRHAGDAGGYERALGVAVDGAGRIVVVGNEGDPEETSGMLVVVLDPDGHEVWRKTIAGYGDAVLEGVAVAADGSIYAGGNDVFDSLVLAFSPAGDPLWTYRDPPADPDSFSVLPGVAVHDGALYSVSFEPLPIGGQLAVRRHDLTTGATAWKTTSKEGTLTARPQAITAVGDAVITVGYAQDPGLTRPMIATLNTAGELLSLEIEDTPESSWTSVAQIGSEGDLVVVGRTSCGAEPDVRVRRLGPGGAVKWTRRLDFEARGDGAHGVAVGEDEAIFVVGTASWNSRRGSSDAFGARFTGDGELLWLHRYDHPSFRSLDSARAAAATAGSFVMAGGEETADSPQDVWVRRLTAE